MIPIEADAPLPDPPANPAPGPPPRRPGSVRRTSTVLMTWPAGFGTQLRLTGRGRDLLTPVAPDRGDPQVLAQDDMYIGVGQDRTLESVEVVPPRAGIGRLVGARGGGQLRSVIRDVVPEDVEAGTPLSLLLDDVAGCTLIAGFAWSRWRDWKDVVAPVGSQEVPKQKRRSMVGICAGFRPGSRALGDDGSSHPEMRHNLAGVPALADPDDPIGWHELDAHPPVAMRRARRIDVWREGDSLAVDAMFRDSCWQPDGLEVAVHEYSIAAEIDALTGQVVAMNATPRVLPFAECPAAAPNAAWLVGAPAQDLRTEVLARLRSTDCCTHLNDALRALAEVPVLGAALAR